MSYAPKRARRALRPLVVTAVAALGLGFATQAAAAPAAKHKQKVEAKVRHDTLEIEGTFRSDTIALRLKAGNPDKLELDVGDDGSAERQFDRDRFDAIEVEAGFGDDFVRIDEVNGIFTDTEATTLDGEFGDDSLAGGSGPEVFRGGFGDDRADGNRGDDTALMGFGDDTFVWDPGDGSDRVEGEFGNNDTMLFNGAAAAEAFDVSANGERVRFFRNVGNITMDLDGVERIDLNALAGSDTVLVNDVRGTDLDEVDVDLAAALTVSAGDGQSDAITVKGTEGNDRIKVAQDGSAMRVSGLAALVRVENGELANDQILIDPLDGTDRVKVRGSDAAETITIAPAAAPSHILVTSSTASASIDLVSTERLIVQALGGDDTIAGSIGLAALTSLTADGGSGDDTIGGGDGVDELLGGPDDDAIDGNRGDDTAFMGSGDDSFTWDPGDGSDRVEGQAGADALLFNGAGAAENIDVSANGQRARFFRDVANITMDLDDTERIEFRALGGADNIVVNDLSGTDVTRVDNDLAGTLGGNAGDGVADRLTVNGTNGDDSIEISGDNGNVDVTGLAARVTAKNAEPALDTLVVNALGGDDTVSAVNLAASAIKLTVDGGAGEDEILGGAGIDLLLGGTQDDLIDGNRGDDVGFLGSENDTFRWDPGDGSDVVEGQNGLDTLLFNGAGAAENIDVSANGGRVRFFRDVASITMDLDDTEKVFFQALGGADNVVVNDLSGTDVTEVETDLAAVIGGAVGDGAPDTVTVNGTNGNDVILVQGQNGTATAAGLAALVRIENAEPANDRLVVRALGGDDVVNALGLAASAIAFTADGGDGNDVLLGGLGGDRLNGEANDDVVNGGPGADELSCGSGNDVVISDAADTVAADCL